MEPFTIIIIGISLAVGAVGAWASWEKILTALKGKKIAVLGARGAGKTTLLLYLNMINLESLEIEQTRHSKKTRSSSIQDIAVGEESKKILLKETVDLPGSEEYRDNGKWKEAFKVADIVLYLVNSAALLRGIDKSNVPNSKIKADEIKSKTQARVEDDLKNIQRWIKELGGANKYIFIIGNHFDEIDENFNKNDRVEKYEKEFKENPAINKHCQRMEKIIGSLKDRDNMKDILEQVVNIMEAKP